MKNVLQLILIIFAILITIKYIFRRNKIEQYNPGSTWKGNLSGLPKSIKNFKNLDWSGNFELVLGVYKKRFY